MAIETLADMSRLQRLDEDDFVMERGTSSSTSYMGSDSPLRKPFTRFSSWLSTVTAPSVNLRISGDFRVGRGRVEHTVAHYSPSFARVPLATTTTTLSKRVQAALRRPPNTRVTAPRPSSRSTTGDLSLITRSDITCDSATSRAHVHRL